jgi:hypothetical protein
MKFIVLKLFLLAIMSNITSLVYSQTNTKELFSVDINIVAKGKSVDSIYNTDGFDTYFITINLLNLQDTSVRFWDINCTGFIDNFFIEGDSISFGYSSSGCDREVPEQITLLPRKAIQLNSIIICYKVGFSTQKIRVGFNYFPTFYDAQNYGDKNVKQNKIKVYRSNVVEIKDNLNRYEIK